MKKFNEDYAKVAERQQVFKEKFPKHKITTELVESMLVDGKHQVIMKCVILDGTGKVAATGHALEREGSSDINKTSWLENAETSAIGRAFRALGIGNEENYASQEEVDNAKEKKKVVEKKEKVTTGKKLTAKAKKTSKPLNLDFITDDRTDLKKIAEGLKMIGITKLQMTPAFNRYDKDGKYSNLANFMAECPTDLLKKFILEEVVGK